MRKSNLDKTLDRMVKRLVKRFDPDQIILFGSHARATARPDSDIDLLVVLPIQGSKRAKQVEMRIALHDWTLANFWGEFVRALFFRVHICSGGSQNTLKNTAFFEIRQSPVHDIRVPKDILVATPEEIDRHRDIPGTIVYPALREGKVLYAHRR